MARDTFTIKGEAFRQLKLDMETKYKSSKKTEYVLWYKRHAVLVPLDFCNDFLAKIVKEVMLEKKGTLINVKGNYHIDITYYYIGHENRINKPKNP